MGLLDSVGKILGKTLKNAPLIGGIITGALEIPNVIKGFQNGDGFSQIGRSACRIGGSVAGIAAATALALTGPAGWIASAALCIGGDWLGGKIGNSLFGKSIEDQKQEYLKYTGQDMAGLYNQSQPYGNQMGLNMAPIQMPNINMAPIPMYQPNQFRQPLYPMSY